MSQDTNNKENKYSGINLNGHHINTPNFLHKSQNLPKPKLTFGQKSSDLLTNFVGSWNFLVGLFIFIFIWMLLNLYAYYNVWDQYPFILLNFVLSCLAAVQAPIILMSQNRTTERDRIKAERDYAVNRKAEREIEDMQQDLEHIKTQIRKHNDIGNVNIDAS